MPLSRDPIPSSGGGTNWGRLEFLGIGDPLNSSGAMKETDKQYFNRRAQEERRRARSANSSASSRIHEELADLCHEKAHGSANVNGKIGIRPDSRISD